MEFQQRQFDEQAGKLAAERLKGHRADVMQAAQWLHSTTRRTKGCAAPTACGAPDQKQPDFEAIGAWIIDVYLNARVEGKTDEEAKQMIKDAIQGSDEWRRVHEAKK